MPAVYYVGDAIEVMGKLPENSVDLVLTSPPFLALRSYLPADHPDKALEGGSQSTPGEFIDWLLDVVEACDRVLAPHGSLAIELGDTYSGSGGAGGDYGKPCPQQSCNDGLDTGSFPKGAADCRTCHGTGRVDAKRGGPGGWRQGQEGYRQVGRVEGRVYDPKYDNAGIWNLDGKVQGSGQGWPLAKSLSLIPETFRFAMVYGRNPHTGRQTEPWRLRNVIRWVRPNPPVGALGDKFRPATSELMVFCKSAKRYFDLDAVRGPWSDSSMKTGGATTKGFGVGPGRTQADHERWADGLATKVDTHGGAPPLDWWNIPPGGYEGAHYAVWPPELCVKPIKAMSPERVCRVCGEPSRRITEPTPEYAATFGQWKWGGDTIGKSKTAESKAVPRMSSEYVTTGWSDCGHDDWRPGLVLDPFAGSGTTLAVATGHGRDAIGVDLDSRNFDLALQRVGPFMLTRG